MTTLRTSKLIILVAMCCVSTGCSQTHSDAFSKSDIAQSVVLLLNDRPKEALILCDKVLVEDPDNYPATLLRGEICEALQYVDEARLAYRRAQRLRPGEKEPRQRLQKLESFNNPTADPSASLSNRQSRLPTGTDASRPDPISEKEYERVSHATNKDENQTVHGLQPQASSWNTIQKIVAEGQRRNWVDRQEARLALMSERQVAEASDPAQFAPAPVTRFDLGLGAELDVFAVLPRVTTTGRQSRLEPQQERPNRMLSGQLTSPSAIRTGRSAARFPGSQGIPLEDLVPEYASPFTCGDGRDNNGNELKDRDDPACWSDGRDPRTYARHLDETQVATPGIGIPSINTQRPVNPSLPTIRTNLAGPSIAPVTIPATSGGVQ